ncbi:hypothetical protein J8273_1585 [Carpediemonas membranifera]|uniref:Uncharacterized protein n=1 Tax=Carpediemonas membranifera TaxID=201153 RepID=A0A8J6E617_9EUKA|nr:hypothetical protein J8273_1585 [Carpediemonas membranifera]|eukprot:KAG9396577.1 hypothetical protein J8273_1585 [Carpediemonas membranifera]
MKNVVRIMRGGGQSPQSIFQVDHDERTLIVDAYDGQMVYKYDHVFNNPTNTEIYAQVIQPALQTILSTRTPTAHSFCAIVLGPRADAHKLLLEVREPDPAHGMLASVPAFPPPDDAGLIIRLASDFFSSGSSLSMSISNVTFSNAKGHGPYTRAVDTVAHAMSEASHISVTEGSVDGQTQIAVESEQALTTLLHALTQQLLTKGTHASMWTVHLTRGQPTEVVHRISFLTVPAAKAGTKCPLQTVLAAVTEKAPTAPFRSSLVTHYLKPFIMGKSAAVVIGVVPDGAKTNATPLLASIVKKWARLPANRRWPAAVAPAQPAAKTPPPDAQDKGDWWARPAQELINSALRDVSADEARPVRNDSPYNNPTRTRNILARELESESESEPEGIALDYADRFHPRASAYQPAPPARRDPHGHGLGQSGASVGMHDEASPTPRAVKPESMLHRAPYKAPALLDGMDKRQSARSQTVEEPRPRPRRPQSAGPRRAGRPDVSNDRSHVASNPEESGRTPVSPAVYKRLKQQLRAANCETIVADTAARRAGEKAKQLEAEVERLREREKDLQRVVSRLEKRNVELERQLSMR